jgi:signal transduction histidine kinase
MGTSKSGDSTTDAPVNTLSATVHEVNNPLEALLNLLYLIGKDPNLSQQSIKYLQTARREVSRVSQIARGAMKQLQTREALSETDLHELLKSVLDVFQPHLRSRNIEVHHRRNGNGKYVVRPEQMKQVLSNLILNAIDAMPEGGKLHVKISTGKEWSAHAQKGLRITVADNGTGILPEHLSRIKEPFFTTKGVKGNGMGLAVVQEIIAQHSGVITVRSSVKRGKSGTILSIFIPQETTSLDSRGLV